MKFPQWMDRNDAVFFVASAVIGYGIWEIYRPAAFIAIGGMFLALSLLGRFK